METLRGDSEERYRTSRGTYVHGATSRDSVYITEFDMTIRKNIRPRPSFVRSSPSLRFPPALGNGAWKCSGVGADRRRRRTATVPTPVLWAPGFQANTVDSDAGGDDQHPRSPQPRPATSWSSGNRIPARHRAISRAPMSSARCSIRPATRSAARSVEQHQLSRRRRPAAHRRPAERRLRRQL